tara:strand:+ start:17772 stop:17981 length:210 start_codon:yes stop_codon:yes gene_type:complete
MTKNKEQDRLTLVEVSVAKLETKLDIIANNHLKHLQDDLTSIKKILWWLFSGITGALISLLFILIQSII